MEVVKWFIYQVGHWAVINIRDENAFRISNPIKINKKLLENLPVLGTLRSLKARTAYNFYSKFFELYLQTIFHFLRAAFFQI